MTGAIEIEGHRLLLRFYRALDEHRFTDAGACFLHDGEWHRKGEVLRGPAAVAAAFAGRAPDFEVRHVVTNMLFEETPTGAKFSLYVTTYMGSRGADGVAHPSSPSMLLLSYGMLQRTGSVWKIRKIVTERKFVID